MAESVRARKSRETRQAERQAASPGRRWATGESLEAIQGPAVLSMQLPLCGEWFLFRRVDLAGAVKAGLWPEPITTAVRGFMARGPEDDEDVVVTQTMAVALARLMIVLPPAELLAGEITEDDIAEDMCVPMFVAPGEPVGEGQRVLLGPGEEAPGGVRLHPRDLALLALRALTNQKGALAAFRGESRTALEGLAKTADDDAPNVDAGGGVAGP